MPGLPDVQTPSKIAIAIDWAFVLEIRVPGTG